MTTPQQIPNNNLANPSFDAGAAIFFGFGTALAIWCGWFITHLPWLGMPEHLSMPLLLLVWMAGAVWAGLGRPIAAAVKVGLSSGILTALLGLLVLGSKVAEPAPGFEAVNPGVALVALGFLTLGAVIGVVGGVAGSVLGGICRCSAGRADGGYLWRFGVVTVLSMAPLLVIGGLVTSTNAGMAVPDWPNTFGSNMFLYPLGPRAAPDVYFEHSHRLFGTFVGLATLVLMVWILRVDARRWVKILAVLAFVLVCIQGILGGIRVIQGSQELAEDPAIWRLVHGVLAQLVFGLVISIAIALTPTFRRAREAFAGSPAVLNGRTLRFLTTGLLHATLLQLLLGAAYRHARDMHSLWSHIAFSIIVVIFAVAAGFAAAALKERYGGMGPILQRTGQVLIAVVTLQFLLGWLAFGFGGAALTPDTIGQALVRTAHQANGALFLALVTIAFVWTRRLLWAERKQTAAEMNAGSTAAAV